MEDQLRGKHIALWGLAFKPDTDDIREAPALYLIDELIAAGASITAYDPEAMSNVQERIGDKINYAMDAYEACSRADFLIIATEWGAFRQPDFARVKKALNSPIIFDGRNLYELSLMEKEGFDYVSMGRKPIKA